MRHPCLLIGSPYRIEVFRPALLFDAQTPAQCLRQLPNRLWNNLA